MPRWWISPASSCANGPPKNRTGTRLAVGFNNLGLAQSKLGHATEAEPSFRQALALQETLVKQDPRDVDLQSALGGMYNNLGIVLEELNRSADAVKAYEQAVAHQQQAVASAPEIARYRQFLSKHYFNYGRVLRQTGHPGDAARAALARRELWPKDPQHLFSVAEELALIARDLSAGEQGRQQRRNHRRQVRRLCRRNTQASDGRGLETDARQQLDQILPGHQEPCGLLGIDEETDKEHGKT